MSHKILLILCLLAVSCTKKENNSSESVQADKTSKVSEDSRKPMSQYKEPNILEIVPGVSLGDVSIGDSDVSLKSKGFELDNNYATPDYMVRGLMLVRLQDRKAIQIFFGGNYTVASDYDRLVFNGKTFPRDQSMKSLQSFFSHCDTVVQGSGGELLYCENRKVRISTSAMKESRVTVSVVLTSDYDQVVTKAK